MAQSFSFKVFCLLICFILSREGPRQDAGRPTSVAATECDTTHFNTPHSIAAKVCMACKFEWMFETVLK